MEIRDRFRRFFAPHSLRFQLLSRSLLLLAVLLAIIGIFQYVFMREFIYQNTASSIRNQISAVPPGAWEQMAGSSGDASGNATEGSYPGLEGRNHFGVFPNDLSGGGHGHSPFFMLSYSTIAFIDLNGNFFGLSDSLTDGGTPPKLPEQDYQNALQHKPGQFYEIMNVNPGGEQMFVLQPVGPQGHYDGVLQVSISTKPLQDMLLRQLVVFLVLAFLALIGGMFAFIPVLRKTLVPLSNMVRKVEQIDAGNLAERLPVEQGQMEIDSLAVSFNGMLGRLESSFAAEKEAKEQMHRFVADASHELRTPLTSIHGFLEVLLRGALNQPDKLEKSLRSMYAESERMKKLVQDLLLLAKLDRSPNIQLIDGELDGVIIEMASQLRVLAGNRKVTLALAEHLRCRFDEDKMKQVLLNLFHNAVQHTDPDTGEIELSLVSAAGDVELAVRDNGSGIPKEHLPHVFDRFYRSDSSRTRKYGGAGLGLAITKSIVELHGGAIGADSVPGKGSVFYVRIPATRRD